MKKLFVSFLIIIFLISSSYAQTKSQIKSLAVLANAWGFLKYYHPEIAGGTHNWDSVLIISVKHILKSKQLYAVNSEIDRMLAIAGRDTASEYKPAPKDTMRSRNYDLSWINNNHLLSLSRKKVLLFIARHPYQGVKYYAQANPGNDSTVVTPNEKPYLKMVFPDVNYRLLCLFRFWNVINYFYPYKYAIGKPWNNVLEEMIPKFINAADTLSYYKALSVMASSINDSHCGLWPQVYDTILGKYNSPFNFKLIDNKAVVTKIADSAPVINSVIKAGSVIEAMDGVSLAERIKQYWNYFSASNNGGKIKKMHENIFRSKNKTASVTGYQADGKKFIAEIQLLERNFLKDYINFFEMESPVTSKMLSDSVAYVFFPNITDKNMDSVMPALMQTKAIIFDMRNYPSNGYATYFMLNYLLSKPTVYARQTGPDFRVPGMMIYKIANAGTDYDHVGKNNPNPYKGKVILLVDERTQSAAEWACMTLQTAPHVTVIGRQTAGADGNVTGITLLGGYQIFFSGLGIYYPDGTETQRTGIHIDIPVEYTIEDIINKNDPVLKRSLEYINSLSQ